jgi:hypothetical protein
MRSIGLLLVLSVAAFGQRVGAGNNTGFNTNSYARPNTFGSITGFGNVVFPGTGHAPIVNHPLPLTTLGNRGNFGVGNRGNGGNFGNGRRFRENNNVIFVPYAIPFYGGGYDNGYGNGYNNGYNGDPGMAPGGYYPQQQGYVQQGYPQQPQAPPMLVINQNFVPETARPVVREYSSDANGGIRVYPPQPSAPAEAAEPAIENPTYLIAFRDHTIYAAVAYWVEGTTLHYVTNQNTHNQVSLDLVDRELSDRLNRERSVDFRLSPSK